MTHHAEAKRAAMLAAPRHRIEMTLKIGVDTADALINELHGIADRLDREGCDAPRNIATGFPGGSWHLEINHDPAMTGELFREALEEWMKSERLRKRAAAR